LYPATDGRDFAVVQAFRLWFLAASGREVAECAPDCKAAPANGRVVPITGNSRPDGNETRASITITNTIPITITQLLPIFCQFLAGLFY